VPRMKLMEESIQFQNRLILPPQNMTRKNFRRDLEDSLVVLLLSRLEDHQKLKLENLRTESNMRFVLLVLLLMRVLFQVVVLLSSMLARSLTILREKTSIKMLALRS